MFITNLWQNPQLYITWMVVVVFSICVHEVAHAWMAARQGDRTAADAGFLSMNPLRLMGPRSLLFMALFGIAWGAVPVNRHRYRHRYSAALVSFSGPFSNLCLAFCFALAAALANRHMARIPALEMFRMVALVGASANCLLFIFNMLPVPMLDGWEVLALPLPAIERLSASAKANYTLVAFLVLMLTPASGFIMQLAMLMGSAQFHIFRRLLGG